LQELGRPLLLAVDQEGGTVARLSPPFTQIPDASALGVSGSESVRLWAEVIAREMYRVGLNMNFAPVLDINTPGLSGVMQRRSFGSKPSLVAQCGVASVLEYQGKMIMATAKHFPGLGRAQKDPHDDLPVIRASKEELHDFELAPFRSAIQANVACVMTSHCLYPALDPDLPATFSPTILHGLLRTQLGFAGVIVTDDLEMGAVGKQYSLVDATIAALNAGADLLLVCNDVEKMHFAAEAVRHGLHRDLLDEEKLALSLARVEKLRQTYLEPLNLANTDEVAAYFSS
jgi:beta-N-acetylhexosaminidase